MSRLQLRPFLGPLAGSDVTEQPLHHCFPREIHGFCPYRHFLDFTRLGDNLHVHILPRFIAQMLLELRRFVFFVLLGRVQNRLRLSDQFGLIPAYQSRQGLIAVEDQTLFLHPPGDAVRGLYEQGFVPLFALPQRLLRGGLPDNQSDRALSPSSMASSLSSMGCLAKRASTPRVSPPGTRSGILQRRRAPTRSPTGGCEREDRSARHW